MLDILLKLTSFVDFIYVCVSCGGENKIVRELQYFLQCSSVHTITLFGSMITETVFL